MTSPSREAFEAAHCRNPADCQSCDGTGSGGLGIGCTDCLGTGREPCRAGCAYPLCNCEATAAEPSPEFIEAVSCFRKAAWERDYPEMMIWQLRIMGLVRNKKTAEIGGPRHERELFAKYIADCDKHAIVPDAAGAFSWAWQAAIQHARDVAARVCNGEMVEEIQPVDHCYNNACVRCADAIKEALK